jgi:hypothetical protein
MAKIFVCCLRIFFFFIIYSILTGSKHYILLYVCSAIHFSLVDWFKFHILGFSLAFDLKTKDLILTTFFSNIIYDIERKLNQ